MFDTVSAVETHFWWPDLPGDLREIRRVLKPNGQLLIVSEIYKGANTFTARLAEQHAPRTGMTLLSLDEHRLLLTGAGFIDVRIDADADKGWMCGIGRK
jgi:SAM-dependent methyltransferase